MRILLDRSQWVDVDRTDAPERPVLLTMSENPSGLTHDRALVVAGGLLAAATGQGIKQCIDALEQLAARTSEIYRLSKDSSP